MDQGFFCSALRLTPNDADVLTEIGVLYLKINDSKSAFERLFDVTKLNERYAKALIALGAILQVIKSTPI